PSLTPRRFSPMRSISRIAFGLLMVPVGATVIAAAHPDVEPPKFVVIVNAENPIDGIDRDDLAKVFLKRSVTWPGGKHVEPLDLPIDDPIRAVFSNRVLHKSLVAVRAYWE